MSTSDNAPAPEVDAKVISLDEVNKHNSEEDCWIVIHGKVYDITKFLDEHPGGSDVVLNASGKDATSEYDDVGHSNTANKMMKEYFIGEYEGGDSAPEGSAQANASPGAFQTLMQFLLPLAIILLALYVRNMTQQK
mmetsp:Transcript_1611/g.3610  ORF Transcript_1611/g.3610 Transcript_1611/m.3610 type:complete len:136 (-) Transcript_1611:1075-1482(-)